MFIFGAFMLPLSSGIVSSGAVRDCSSLLWTGSDKIHKTSRSLQHLLLIYTCLCPVNGIFDNLVDVLDLRNLHGIHHWCMFTTCSTVRYLSCAIFDCSLRVRVLLRDFRSPDDLLNTESEECS